MKARTGSRWIRRVALGLAVTAIVAPAVQAQVQPYGELYQHHAVQPYGELYQHEFLPDGTTVAAAGVPLAQAYADALEATQRLAPDSPPLALHQPATPTTGERFDYGDAGIGAAIALGAMLVAAAVAIGLRRRGLVHTTQV